MSVLVAALFAGLVLSASPAAAQNNSHEVVNEQYYTRPVQWLTDNNIVTDTTPACFGPNVPATRGETALYMWRIAGQLEAPPHPFDDVTDDALQPAVAWMYDSEITTGTSPTTFGPNQQLTRAQVAAFLHRLAGKPSASGHPFVDVFAAWQQQPVAWMDANKITTGTSPTTFAPNVPVTRAQLATFLYRYQNSPEVTVTPQSPQCDTFTALDAGKQHSCAIRTDAIIACWGNNEYGQANAPDGYFREISTGGLHTCGIRTNNTITCWGVNWANTGMPNAQFTEISAGSDHSCGLHTDATLSCWGSNWAGQTAAPGGQFSAVSAGHDHSCGIRTDSTIECWGDNERGQTNAPEGQFTAVSSGNYHSCALRTDSIITCWGHNGNGQTSAPPGKFAAISAGTWRSCGVHIDATITCWGNVWAGHPVAPDGQFSTVSAGHEHSCALGTNNTVTCWGKNWADQPVAPDGEFTDITTGDDHSCGIHTNGTIECWGLGNFGQTYAPVGSFTDVAVGTEHSCGIRTDATIECWGRNLHGQTIAPDGQFTAVSAGAWHSCGLRTDSTIECWGNNGSGQTNAPNGQFTAVSAGAWHSCGIRTDATVTCWGANLAGTDPPAKQFRTISAGRNHTCGIRIDATIECWGNNGSGQTNAPDGQFTAISAGAWHSCAIQTNTQITCWGRIAGVQTGSYIALSAGTRQSCGLRANSTISCWSEPTISTPSGVGTFFRPGQADPGMCRPFGTSGGATAGFPLPSGAVRSTGAVRVAVLFVDFPNAEASHSTQTEAELGLPYAEKYLETVSYGKFDVEFTPLHRWLRAEHNYQHYQTSIAAIGEDGVGAPILADAVQLADPDFDFTGYDALMVVLPSPHFGGGLAAQQVLTDEGSVARSTLINNVAWGEPREPYRWGDVAAHELIHNLGLLDMYPYDPTSGELPEPPAGKTWVTSSFGPMGLRVTFPADPQDPRLLTAWLHPYGFQSSGYAASSEAEEMLAWSRWQLGWLDAMQISCVSENEATVTLSPVAEPRDSIAMAAIPLSGTEVIVIESRRKIGYDQSREEHYFDGTIGTFPALLTEGVLVYTVDASLQSGQLPLAIAGDTGNLQLDRYPILTDGESVTIRGYTITVQSSTDTTHTVSITKTAVD